MEVQVQIIHLDNKNKVMIVMRHASHAKKIVEHVNVHAEMVIAIEIKDVKKLLVTPRTIMKGKTAVIQIVLVNFQQQL